MGGVNMIHFPLNYLNIFLANIKISPKISGNENIFCWYLSLRLCAHGGLAVEGKAVIQNNRYLRRIFAAASGRHIGKVLTFSNVLMLLVVSNVQRFQKFQII